MDAASLEQQLRHRLLGHLHVGRVRPGDRLPSIREVARASGADHRAVAEAYRALRDEGLVEIRPGSGVYVAGEERSDAVPAEVTRWLGGLLVEAWARRISREELGALVERCATASLRCAFVESTEDHMVALSAEVAHDFSLQPLPVPVPPDAARGDVDPEALRGADLVVTSVFHAEAVQAAAAAAERPCVVASFHADLAGELDRRLREGPLTAVVADPAFRARGERFLRETAHRGRVRFVTVDELADEAADVDLAHPRVVVSRAARRRLGLPEYHFLPPPFTVVSAESARRIALAVSRLALERAGR